MIYHQWFRWSTEQLFLSLFQRMALASASVTWSWWCLLPPSIPATKTQSPCTSYLSISWKHPCLSIFSPSPLVRTTMIFQSFFSGLPFSILDPFQFILLIVVRMFPDTNPLTMFYTLLSFKYLPCPAEGLTDTLASQCLGHLIPSEYFLHCNSAMHSLH